MPDLDDLKNAIDERGKAWEEQTKTINTALEEQKKAGIEQKDAYNKLSGEIKEKLQKLDDVIVAEGEQKKKLEERLGLIETAVKRGAVGGEHKEMPTEVEEYKTAFFNALQSGQLSSDTRNTDLIAMGEKAAAASPEFKALARQSEPDGGYLVPPDVSGRVVDVIRESSPMRSVASVQGISTDALEGMADTQQVTFEWVGETEEREETTTPQVKKWRINVHECSARVHISQQLIEDAQMDVESWCIEKIADKFRRGEANAFVQGNGDGKPRGYITYPHADPNPNNDDAEGGIQPWKTMERIASGAAGDLTDADNLMELRYALKADYLSNARWAFSREGYFKIRLLKQDGKYVWQPGLQAGQPDMILGYPTVEFNDLPAFADGAVVGSFGDFRRTYQIVDRIQMSLLRDPYTVKPFVELYARRRVGADVINFDTMKLMEASVSVS